MLNAVIVMRKRGSSVEWRIDINALDLASELLLQCFQCQQIVAKDQPVELSVQTNKPFARSSNMLLATTSHSFKGYDSEVVIIPAVDQYRAKDRGILANNLYVAMTRARSVLTLFAQRMSIHDSKTIYRVIEECLDNLHERPQVDSEISPQDDLVDILAIIGEQHRKWLIGLWSHHRVSQEPLLTKTGEVIAEPLLSFKAGGKTYACFGNEGPRQRVTQRLEDFGVSVLEVGQEIEGVAKA